MVVLDALDMLQEQALRSHGWSMLMWNREDEEAKAGWWPTWEDTLSNLVCAFLREHLAGHKLVINREVEIQPAASTAAGPTSTSRPPTPGTPPPSRSPSSSRSRAAGTPRSRPASPASSFPTCSHGPAGPGSSSSATSTHPSTSTPSTRDPRKRRQARNPGAAPDIEEAHAGADPQRPPAASRQRPGTLIYARVLQLPLVLPSASGAETA